MPWRFIVCGLLLLTCSAATKAPEPGCAFNESQCRSKADSATAKWNWGAPKSIDFRDSVYDFTYPTPEEEVALLSWRSVQVNCKTGMAWFPPRK
jgi:hypothetical protein